MPVKLNVPFSGKEEAKKAGAKWDAEDKTWYIPNTDGNWIKFDKWIAKNIDYIVLPPHIITHSRRECWKCRNETPLIALGARTIGVKENKDENSEEMLWNHHEVNILFTNITFLNEEIANVLKQKYSFFKLGFSNLQKRKVWANHCVHCDSIQGEFYIFNTPGEAFFPTTIEDAKEIRLEYLELKYDYFINAEYYLNEVFEWILNRD